MGLQYPVRLGGWWLQLDVQKARSLFCQQYTYLDKENWLQEWKTALNEISKLN